MGYLAPEETCDATEAHYGFFESLISQRDLHGSVPPSDAFRRMSVTSIRDETGSSSNLTGELGWQGAQSDAEDDADDSNFALAFQMRRGSR